MFEDIPLHIREVFFKCILENEVDHINFPCYMECDNYKILFNSKEDFMLTRNKVKNTIRKIKLDKVEKL